ncbi:DUF2218 domain-containing protein [Frigidibacter sp. ROC022]|uniref:DUF2218 domain-containing protein n=1 Tax=Frigidibacter sp. ROC022 TaxID=2971796 RepID=UPI00215B3878|nr:DUF2218 domain-containing protein [Frigidibacter sp. ROC022]MCR8724673.1 DUF2218 domain-containing protein [Frigidibacter sp. ROC022]
MPDKLIDEGRFVTGNASRYLQQLCKHFSHKVPVRFDARSGEAELPAGKATLAATETELTVVLSADSAEGLDRSRGVIDSHLERFAFREDFKTMNWLRRGP